MRISLAFLVMALFSQGAGQKPEHPSLFGYRLETRRSAMPSSVACMADDTCQPSDSVTLYFGGGVLHPRQDSTLLNIEMHTALPESRETPLRRWQTFYQPWAVSRLGPVDSVRLSPNAMELHAYWRTSAWWADITIEEVGGSRPHTFVKVNLLCQSIACRRLH